MYLMIFGKMICRRHSGIHLLRQLLPSTPIRGRIFEHVERFDCLENDFERNHNDKVFYMKFLFIAGLLQMWLESLFCRNSTCEPPQNVARIFSIWRRHVFQTLVSVSFF